MDCMARTYRLGFTRRAVNRLLTLLLRAGLPMGSSYLLTTTGRKTGVQRTTPVTLVEAGSDRWLVAPYGAVSWVHNVRAHPQVRIRRGSSVQEARAREVGAPAAGPVLQAYLGKVAVVRPFFDAKPGDPVDRFSAEAGRHPVFHLEPLTPADGTP
jgi:deazaflavin-dependent oxidoreductase (nitroreductase family)